MTDQFFKSSDLLTPTDLGRITGISPEKQRDWRRHGYISDKVGKQSPNRRWTYDWTDALMLSVMQQLHTSGVELSLAYRIAGTVGGHIVLWAMYDRGIYQHPTIDRYYRMFRDPRAKNEKHGGWAMQPISSLEACAGTASAILIDSRELAKGLSTEFDAKFVELGKSLIAEIKSGEANE